MKKEIFFLLLGFLSVQLMAQNKQATKPKVKTTTQKTATKQKLMLNTDYTTASGLKYRITEFGTGKQLEKGDLIAVHYTGKLSNGTKFDSSRDRNQPISFNVGTGRVIPGWDEGLLLLKVGDKAIFEIPPHLGYGANDMGPIPANSTLVFDVEVMSATTPAPPVKPVPYDVKGKDTLTTASGLRYIKVASGNGVQAENGKTVEVHYTGYLMDGKQFDSSVERGQSFNFPLGMGSVIKGWEEGIALMKVGDKMRLIIPSDIAYGPEGRNPVIPPNATLIFDVELLNVK